MIRPLRSRHRRMILGIALVVSLLMVLGLLARRSIPLVDELPGAAPARAVDAANP